MAYRFISKYLLTDSFAIWTPNSYGVIGSNNLLNRAWHCVLSFSCRMSDIFPPLPFIVSCKILRIGFSFKVMFPLNPDKSIALGNNCNITRAAYRLILH